MSDNFLPVSIPISEGANPSLTKTQISYSPFFNVSLYSASSGSSFDTNLYNSYQ